MIIPGAERPIPVVDATSIIILQMSAASSAIEAERGINTKTPKSQMVKAVTKLLMAFAPSFLKLEAMLLISSWLRLSSPSWLKNGEVN